MNIINITKTVDFKIRKKNGNLGFTMIIKIILLLALLVFFIFFATGARESMLTGIRKIFTFGR